MESSSTDLFDAQVHIEAQKLAREELRRMLDDPRELQQILAEKVGKLREVTQQRDEAVGRWNRFFDAEGYVDAATASSTLRIPYINPSGETLIMGRNHVLRLLEKDGVVIRTPNGYRLSSAWEKSGRGITRLTNINDRIRSVALFNADGLQALASRYEKDKRVWHSNTKRDLWHE